MQELIPSFLDELEKIAGPLGFKRWANKANRVQLERAYEGIKAHALGQASPTARKQFESAAKKGFGSSIHKQLYRKGTKQDIAFNKIRARMTQHAPPASEAGSRPGRSTKLLMDLSSRYGKGTNPSRISTGVTGPKPTPGVFKNKPTTRPAGRVTWDAPSGQRLPVMDFGTTWNKNIKMLKARGATSKDLKAAKQTFDVKVAKRKWVIAADKTRAVRGTGRHSAAFAREQAARKALIKLDKQRRKSLGLP